MNSLLASTAMISLFMTLIFGILRYMQLKQYYRISKEYGLKMLGQYYLSFRDLKYDFRFSKQLLFNPRRILQADQKQQETLWRIRRWDIWGWISVIVFLGSITTLGILVRGS